MAEPEVRRALPLWLIVVLGVAGTAVAIWGIRAAAPILGPVVLAFVLTVTVHPLVGALVRRGVRRGGAAGGGRVVVGGGGGGPAPPPPPSPRPPPPARAGGAPARADTPGAGG